MSPNGARIRDLENYLGAYGTGTYGTCGGCLVVSHVAGIPIFKEGEPHVTPRTST